MSHKKVKLNIIQESHVHCHAKKAKLNLKQKGQANCNVDCRAEKIKLNVRQKGQADSQPKWSCYYSVMQSGQVECQTKRSS